MLLRENKRMKISISSINGSENIPREPNQASPASPVWKISTFSSSKEHFCEVGHAKRSLSHMWHYFQTGKLCDVVLISHNNKRVPAHRLVLSAESGYFCAMFADEREGKKSEVMFAGINYEELYALINYCYTGTIEIRDNNVGTLLEISTLMQLSAVTQACSRFLALQLHPNNCLGIAVFAKFQKCNSLLQESMEFIRRNFVQVVLAPTFLQLSVDQMATLLASEVLHATLEKHFFQVLANWFNYDAVNRQPHFEHFLRFVKLPPLGAAMPRSDATCRELNIEAIQDQISPTMSLETEIIPQRATLGRLLVVGGAQAPITTMENYDPRNNCWTNAYNLSGPRLLFGTALLGGKILIVGGTDGVQSFKTVEGLDMKTGTWSQLSEMNNSRYGLGVGVLNGLLYAVGGLDKSTYQVHNTVERYDPVTNKWSYVAPMRDQRYSAGVAVLGGKLYAVGGQTNGTCLNSVECYDPNTNKWTICTQMTSHRRGIGIAAAYGYLYVMGGLNAASDNPAASRLDSVERYDPGNNTWTVIASLSSKRDAVSACLFVDRIVVVGGFDGQKYLRTVEQYDLKNNKWSLMPPLINGRAGACIVAV